MVSDENLDGKASTNIPIYSYRNMKKINEVIS